MISTFSLDGAWCFLKYHDLVMLLLAELVIRFNHEVFFW